MTNQGAAVTTDLITPTIEEAIQQENDPEKRSHLILLNRMAQEASASRMAIEANTRFTEKLSARLEDHIAEFQMKVDSDEALKNKGLGAWKILAWVLGIAQIVIGWGLLEARAEAGKLTTSIAAHAALDSQLRSDLSTAINNSTVADLRLASRIDRTEDRCSRLEATGGKK